MTVCVTQSKTNRVVSTRFRAQNSSLLLATVSAVSNLLVGRSRSGTPSVHTEPPRYSTVTTRRGAELTTTPEKSVCVRTERALPEPSTTIDSFLRVAKLVFLVPECFARLSVCVKTCQEECFLAVPSDSVESTKPPVQVDLWRQQPAPKVNVQENNWPLRTENTEIWGRETPLWYFFGYLEVSNTKTDLRNVFFSKFWV